MEGSEGLSANASGQHARTHARRRAGAEEGARQTGRAGRVFIFCAGTAVAEGLAAMPRAGQRWLQCYGGDVHTSQWVGTAGDVVELQVAVELCLRGGARTSETEIMHASG